MWPSRVVTPVFPRGRLIINVSQNCDCQRITERMRTLDVNFSFKVSVVEDLNGNLLFAVVDLAKLRVLDIHVFLDILARELDLLVDTSSNLAHDVPVRESDWPAAYQENEKVCPESTAVDQRNCAFDEVWDTED